MASGGCHGCGELDSRYLLKELLIGFNYELRGLMESLYIELGHPNDKSSGRKTEK